MKELVWERFEEEGEESAWKLRNDDLWCIWIYEDGADPFTAIMSDIVGDDIEEAQFHLISEAYNDWLAEKLPWQKKYRDTATPEAMRKHLDLREPPPQWKK